MPPFLSSKTTGAIMLDHAAMVGGACPSCPKLSFDRGNWPPWARTIPGGPSRIVLDKSLAWLLFQASLCLPGLHTRTPAFDSVLLLFSLESPHIRTSTSSSLIGYQSVHINASRDLPAPDTIFALLTSPG